jgi:hypothetical protein
MKSLQFSIRSCEATWHNNLEIDRGVGKKAQAQYPRLCTGRVAMLRRYNSSECVNR